MQVQAQMEQIRERCKQAFAKAQQLYGLDMSKVGISFDLKGRAAGMAHRRGTQYYMRFNRDMLTREAFDHVLNNTVPHEVAHLVCFMNPKLGRNHDAGWAYVCRALGGTGARTHQEDVVYGKGTTYEYITTTGNTVRVSDRYHRNIQQGQTYNYRKGLGSIHKDCAHSIVGYQGRTLATPKVLKAPAPSTVQIPMDRAGLSSWAKEKMKEFGKMEIEVKDPMGLLPPADEKVIPTEVEQRLPGGDEVVLSTGTLEVPPETLNVDTGKPAELPLPPAEVQVPADVLQPTETPVAVVLPTTGPTHKVDSTDWTEVGITKVEIARRLMTVRHAEGKTFEEVLEELIPLAPYSRQLARRTMVGLHEKMGFPKEWLV